MRLVTRRQLNSGANSHQQNLGVIRLQREEEEEIDVVEWAAVAAESASHALSEVSSLRQSLQDQQRTIQKLTAQLDALSEAKKKHDAQLLEKFSKLLNAKKLKIREQQRILASAQPDRAKGMPPIVSTVCHPILTVY
jgi:hypothetical protein